MFRPTEICNFIQGSAFHLVAHHFGYRLPFNFGKYVREGKLADVTKCNVNNTYHYLVYGHFFLSHVR